MVEDASSDDCMAGGNTLPSDHQHVLEAMDMVAEDVPMAAHIARAAMRDVSIVRSFLYPPFWQQSECNAS